MSVKIGEAVKAGVIGGILCGTGRGMPSKYPRRRLTQPLGSSATMEHGTMLFQGRSR